MNPFSFLVETGYDAYVFLIGYALLLGYFMIRSNFVSSTRASWCANHYFLSSTGFLYQPSKYEIAKLVALGIGNIAVFAYSYFSSDSLEIYRSIIIWHVTTCIFLLLIVPLIPYALHQESITRAYLTFFIKALYSLLPKFIHLYGLPLLLILIVSSKLASLEHTIPLTYVYSSITVVLGIHLFLSIIMMWSLITFEKDHYARRSTYHGLAKK